MTRLKRLLTLWTPSDFRSNRLMIRRASSPILKSTSSF
ncbi:hypothetical protein HID58_068012 [Brassica napus]|uniref:Uncharacterized protein n=1 Tax=Brassica napus TaxID=3708 RepID=A0ABQ7ZKH9_BRANA|nr:hypothetical protein HID58_068012 [Brassica napus]